MLKEMEKLSSLDEAEFVRLQNAIVEPGFEDPGYRSEMVYVAEQLALRRQLIHYLAPKPEDVPALMKGLIACMERMASAQLAPLVQAAVAAVDALGGLRRKR